MSEIKKRKKKKTGSAAYAIFLTLWILLLAGLIYYGLKTAWRVAELYEEAEITPVLQKYMEQLSTDLWDEKIADTISAMPHEFQTDEECAEVVKEILNEEIRYVRRAGSGDTVSYDLLCGNSRFGLVKLVQERKTPDEEKIVQQLVEHFNLYPWRIESEEFYFDGLYTSVEVTVPADYTVLINGHSLGQDYVVESGIHYDVLEGYYEDYQGLPTKTTYRADHIFGHVAPTLLDAHGNETTVDPEQNDSQFIEPVNGETYNRLYEFGYAFASRYLEFSAGTTDMTWLYDRLVPFISKGSDLDARLKKAMEGYAGWQHNSKFRFGDATLNDVISLGNGWFVLDITANASALQPIGEVRVERSMKVTVHMSNDDVRAYSVEDY